LHHLRILLLVHRVAHIIRLSSICHTRPLRGHLKRTIIIEFILERNHMILLLFILLDDCHFPLVDVQLRFLVSDEIT